MASLLEYMSQVSYPAHHKRIVLCQTQFTSNTVEDADEANEDDLRSFGLMKNEPLLDNTNEETYPTILPHNDRQVKGEEIGSVSPQEAPGNTSMVESIQIEKRQTHLIALHIR